jgi:hypothetical protein
MNPDKLLKLANLFYSIADSHSKEQLPKNSEDLPKVLKNIESLDTYKARVDYAEKNMDRLSSGSARIAFKTNEDTVIKLAKNDKGIAQNKAEVKASGTSKFINKCIRHAKNMYWVEVEYLDKITEKDFEKLSGIPFKDFGEAISYGLKDIAENSDKKKPKNFDKVSKTEIYKEIKRVGVDLKLLPGDLERISSWHRKGKQLMLVDAGLTRKVYDDYYDDSSSS